MKKSIGIILACSLILTVGAIVWAQVAAKETTKVTGGGWYIADGKNCSRPSITGQENNHCSFGFQAREKGGNWSGRGSFMDRDYRLKAILTVEDMEILRDLDCIRLYGTARVYVDNKFVDECPFFFGLVEGAHTSVSDRAGFGIPALNYYAHGTLSGGEIKFH